MLTRHDLGALGKLDPAHCKRRRLRNSKTRYCVPSKVNSADLVRICYHGHDCQAGYRTIEIKDSSVLQTSNEDDTSGRLNQIETNYIARGAVCPVRLRREQAQ
jgi:hypothetical protein